MNTAFVNEEPMVFTSNSLTHQKEVVRKFYHDMWDYADISLIPDIFHEDFTFRGSLGPLLVGHEKFADYVRWVTGTLENYKSDILEIVEENNKVSAKMRFHGVQKKQLFGQPPTNKHVWWYGAPIFTFSGDKVIDLWVLGDIYGLISRITDNDEHNEFETRS